MKARITKRLVDGVETPAKGKRTKVYDDKVTGFGLSVTPTGRKSFFVEYGPRGKRRRYTLGPYGALTVEQARVLAQEKLATFYQGGDPMADRDAQRGMPTFGDWVDTYLADIERRKKSVREDRRFLGRARKLWEGKLLDAISAEDVRRAMADESAADHPIRGNRWLASVRACLSAAWRSDLIAANPAMKVRPNRENTPRDRVLSSEEVENFMAAAQELENPHVRAAMLLLLLTGARMSEVLGASWSDFDLDEAIWRIPNPKAGRPQVIPIHADAVALLRELPRNGPWVVPGRWPEQHRHDLKGPWAEVKEKAGLADVTIHDLRRTFGLMVTRTAGLHVASKLLRHSSVTVTESVYAPLGTDGLRAGLDQSAVARPKVIPFRKKVKEG